MATEQQKAIWILDDDLDDHDLIREIFSEMKWKHALELFCTPDELMNRLDQSPVAPFIIISDVNLPKMDGLTLREKILQQPNNKFHSVPFIFWSTQPSEQQVREAYRLYAHGFFRKEATLAEWRRTLIRIIDYWAASVVPSNEDKPDPPLITDSSVR